jgi:predicted DNA binding CopG/RHH family protein
MSTKRKPMPSLRSDAEAEAFTAKADLTQYDLSGFKPMQFEIARKEAALNMRIRLPCWKRILPAPAEALVLTGLRLKRQEKAGNRK